jgi:hypothetical protein
LPPKTKSTDREFERSRERIMRWRKGGPALFAVEALGMPEHYDAKRGTGVMDWWWEASKKLVLSHRLSIRSGHGVGKSAFLAITVIWFMTCYFPCKIPATAPTAHQLEDVLWAEIAKWHRVLEEKMPALAAQFEWTRDQYRMLAAPKESFAVARTARADKPEALQGFHSDNLLIVADEASGIPDIIFEVGQGALSSDGAFAILTGNPTRRSGFFFDTHHKLRERWETVVVSGENCPLVSQQFKDDIAHQYGGESNVYRVRVLGEFPSADEDVVIPLDLCEAAKMRDVDVYGEIIWGVDIARFGKDRTVLVKRRANATIAPHRSWSGQDTMQTAGRIYADWLETSINQRPKNIFVDVIGIGAGVVDRLQELGLPVSGVNVAEEASVSELYLRLRDELWFRARKWLEKKDCKLHEDETLIAELSLPKYSITSTGKLKVESKDEMKKRYPQSPDVADAFCMTFVDAAEHRGRESYDPPLYADA